MADAQGMIIENVKDDIATGLDVYDNQAKKVGTVWEINRVPGYLVVRSNRLSGKDLHVPFRLVTNIDPRELFLSLSREELYRDYATSPPRTTRVVDEHGDRIAVTTEPSGYDGAPIVVRRASIDDLKRSVTVGDRVFSSDPTELGTIKHYEEAADRMWIVRDSLTNEPTLKVPVTLVDSVNTNEHEVYLVSSEADLERMEHLEPA